MIGQSCCNHWDCPACGVKRARQEYRRIVAGCEEIAQEHDLYFWTITCRGRECSLEEAEEHYYEWTNVLLTNARAKAKRNGQFWVYVQVTERQKKTRHHPHSHIITSFLPADSVVKSEGKRGRDFHSAWFDRANESAHLGSQHRISEVQSAAAVARYVAKYMFKATMQETWPVKWKRVRYGDKFPKLVTQTPDFVSVLLGREDWERVARAGETFTCETPAIYELAFHHIHNIARSRESGQST